MVRSQACHSNSSRPVEGMLRFLLARSAEELELPTLQKLFRLALHACSLHVPWNAPVLLL